MIASLNSIAHGRHCCGLLEIGATSDRSGISDTEVQFVLEDCSWSNLEIPSLSQYQTFGVCALSSAAGRMIYITIPSLRGVNYKSAST